MVARNYWNAGGVRRFMATKILNAILIERKQPPRNDNLIDDTPRGIGDSGSLILFPKGTRSPRPDPAPFKSGLFHLVRTRPGKGWWADLLRPSESERLCDGRLHSVRCSWWEFHSGFA